MTRRIKIMILKKLICFIVRLKFQKRSTLKFVSRTIPHSGGYNMFPKLALGVIPVMCQRCKMQRMDEGVL
jgi:hypothetical protein